MIILFICLIIISSIIFNFKPWIDFKNGILYYRGNRRTKKRLYKKLWEKN